jgi:hypothetical protein
MKLRLGECAECAVSRTADEIGAGVPAPRGAAVPLRGVGGVPATLRRELQVLNARQLRAVDLVAGGGSDRDVAEVLGCDASTVWRWRTGNPAFGAALNARRHELWEHSLDRVRALVPRALDVVEQAIDAGDSRAAMALLKLAGLGSIDLGAIGPSEAGLIAQEQERERVRRERERVEETLSAAEWAADVEFRRRLASLS